VNLLRQCPTTIEKLAQLLRFLNTGSRQEIEIMEAIKLLMFLCSIDLHEANTAGKDVPVFVWLLFARDTSETPSQFLRHHLNPVGDSSGVEQVRMYV